MGEVTDGTTASLPAIVTSAEDFLAHDYDYLILGGGTAGLVLAARLTENPAITVGVLEAGKNRLNDPLVDTPAAFIHMLGNPEYDWNLKTVPQSGDHNRTHHIPRGKALGGSSAINYMMYVRGSERDYDDWAALTSSPSWSFAAMRPYIRKHQTLEPPPSSIANTTAMNTVPANHGTDGPIRTSFNPDRLPLEDAWIAAADAAAGVGRKPVDAWSGDHYGFYNGLGSVYRTGALRGKRSYAARGYLEENAHRPNLRVLCEAAVTGVVLEGAGTPRATGARFEHAGKRYEVKARREVLVCGGAIHSPQILELSGIGDPKVLAKAGVETKVELKSVGENLQDHTVAVLAYETVEGEMTGDSLHHPDAMAAAQKALVEEGAGPLTGVLSGQGFLSYKQLATPEELEQTIASIRETQKTSTPFQRRQLDTIIAHLLDPHSANLQFIMVPATGALTPAAAANQALLWPPRDPSLPAGTTWATCLQYPVSRGSVHITSADHTVQPTINPRYNTHPADLALQAAGLRLLDRVAHHPLVAPRIAGRVQPAPDIDLQTGDAAETAVKDFCIGEYHVAGSCAMGDTVDAELRVKGVDGLRVIDASVFPGHVSGNCQSSVYALAERGADVIKESWA